MLCWHPGTSKRIYEKLVILVHYCCTTNKPQMTFICSWLCFGSLGRALWGRQLVSLPRNDSWAHSCVCSQLAVRQELGGAGWPHSRVQQLPGLPVEAPQLFPTWPFLVPNSDVLTQGLGFKMSWPNAQMLIKSLLEVHMLILNGQSKSQRQPQNQYGEELKREWLVRGITHWEPLT